MTIKDYWDCMKDGKRKKNEKLIKRILTAALILYIPICSLSDSIHKGVDRGLSSMVGRIIVIEEDNTGIYEKAENYFKEDKRVAGVYPYVYQISMQIENFIETEGYLLGSVQAYDDCMEEYVCEGAHSLNENEILIPKYLYGYGDGERYKNGEEYIGKTIELIFRNSFLKTEKTEQFIVVGTYDNIYGITGDMNFLINSKKAVEFYEFDMDGLEQEKQKMMEESGDYDESHYHGFENTYYYAIFLADRSYAEEILEESWKEFGTGSLILRESQDSIANIFDAVRSVSGILSGVLFIVLATVLVMGTAHDIEARKWEFAMKLAFGYQKWQLVLITFLEYVRLTLGAFIITMLFSVLFNIAGNYMIENILPEELMCIHLSISGYTAAVGLVMAILTAVVSVPVALSRMKDMNIGETLKAEC